MLIWSLSSECVTHSELLDISRGGSAQADGSSSHLGGALPKHLGWGWRPQSPVLLWLLISELLKTSVVKPIEIAIYRSDKFFDFLESEQTLRRRRSGVVEGGTPDMWHYVPAPLAVTSLCWALETSWCLDSCCALSFVTTTTKSKPTVTPAVPLDPPTSPDACRRFPTFTAPSLDTS